MRVRDDEDDEVVEVNMAPLIDCIFLLLIFFLLTSTIQQTVEERRLQELPLVLPESAAAREAPAQPSPLILSVDEHGRFYVNRARVGIEPLHQAVRQAAQAQQRIRIEGDRRTSFDHVARLIDLCAFEGIADVAVRTKDQSP